MNLSLIGALLLSTALVIGALSAHALDPATDVLVRLGTSQAVTIQLVHGAIFFVAGLFALNAMQRAFFALILLGLLLFCGSVYLKSFGYFPSAPMAPIGGATLIFTWVALGIYLSLSKTPWKQSE